MIVNRNRLTIILLSLILAILIVIGVPASALAAPSKDFTVVIDAGHGGKDHGAIDNGAREKDINLAVALRLGELINKKLKDTKVVYTRDDDTFVSLQGRADIANKAKGDLFISIHTNSVDAKNKNRTTVAGASVYTQGGHKDEANLEVAKRENSVIELENGYHQKYSGFDPNKVESYIIFEMAAKHNIAQSHRFAKNVQDNLVKVAGRKDRGVHQAGFWVLWATSMPSALIELDFICNPDAAKFLTSKDGVDKLANAIFEAVKDFEKDFRQKQKIMSENSMHRSAGGSGHATSADNTDFAHAIHAGVGTSRTLDDEDYGYFESTSDESRATLSANMDVVAISETPEPDKKDLSHSNLKATANQTRARHAYDGRRRRSATAAAASEARNLTVSHIPVKEESTGGQLARVEPVEETPLEEVPVTVESSNKKKDKNKKGKKASTAKTSADTHKNAGDTRKAIAEANARAREAEKDAKEAAKAEAAKKQAGREAYYARQAEKAEAEKRETEKKNQARKRSFDTYSGTKDTTTASTGTAGQHAGERKSIKRR